MATTWERLAGDTSRFALRLSFSDDPDPSIGSTVEESSSWGSFQLWVQEQNLCAYRFAEEQFQSVHWYLLPLIEWFVDNWDPLLHEERLPNQNAAASAQESLRRTADAPLSFPAGAAEAWEQHWYDWWGRHCLEAARFGGVYPSVFFRRWRDRVEVSWDQSATPAGAEGVRFLCGAGVARVALGDVATALYPVLKEAVEYLYGRNPESARLRRLQQQIARLSRRREERLAWLLGFGASFSDRRASVAGIKAAVSALPERARQAIWERSVHGGLFIEPFPAALMFGAVSPNLAPEDRIELLEHLAESVAPKVTSQIDTLAEETPLDEQSPREQGYELAQRFLARLDGTNEPSAVDVESILAELGVQTRWIRLEDEAIRGVAIAGPSYRPTILLNQRHRAHAYPPGIRFSLAHALCHLLYDRTRAREVALPSGPWSPKDVEQRANAFAAMLLMPVDRLRRLVALMGEGAGARDLVTEACSRFQTSFTATLEHLYTVGLLTEEEREELLHEAFDLPTLTP